MELNKTRLRQTVNREQRKYIELYKEDENYGHNQHKTAEMLRGNKKVRRELHKILKYSTSLLDLGCGKGFYTRYIENTYPNLKVVCVDIAAKEIMKHRPDMKILQASANELPIMDNYFDIVFHLDGLEHIPEEIEENVIAEELRVSKKYVYHQISTNPVSIDEKWEGRGLGAIHINIKTEKEWKKTFINYAKKYKLRIRFFISYKGWVFVLLEKR